MRILLVKTSSLGDVIHNLPVVTDIVRHHPSAQIDWVVEEAFSDIPRLHPAVARVIPVAVRRWRKSLLTRTTWGEISALRKTLREHAYDAIIDTQGLLKSALIARQANGPIHGMDKASAREALAAHFYTTAHAVPRNLHAVMRNRLLTAEALAYSVGGLADYGLSERLTAAPQLQRSVNPPTATLLTATSRDDKLWQESNWIQLGSRLADQGYRCLCPAGSKPERERAGRIAEHIENAQVVPPSSLEQLAGLLLTSAVVVGVDTGLVHLAAALGRPTVALYCASTPGLTGVLADIHSRAGVLNLGGPGASPGVDEVMAACTRLLASQ